MWLIVGVLGIPGSSNKEIRIASFSSKELAEEYLEKSRCDLPGFIFSPKSLLKDYCWATVVFDPIIPLDPKYEL